MSAISIEILIVLLLTVANGVFVIAEMAVVSARKARLQQWANEGDLRAHTALQLANAPGRFLPTVQLGMTLVAMLTGAFGGATIAERLSSQLSRIEWLAPYSTAVSLAVVVVTITYLSVVLGELTPKRLALHSPEKIACAVARPMQRLAELAAPLVRLLSASSGWAMRLLGIQPSGEPPFTQDEIRLLIDQATQAGVFEASEQVMVERVFRLTTRRVSALMTPRTEIAWLDVGDSADEISNKIVATPHANYPVCQENLDNVLGVVRARDILVGSLSGEPVELKVLLRSPVFVPDSMLASRVLELCRQSETHMVLVIDEFGGLQGLVTMNDVVAEIVGEIELDQPQVVQRLDGSWLMDGMIPIHQFKELVGVKQLPGEERDNYQTLGGFVMMQMGRVPSPTDRFRWNGLSFEVTAMVGHRVDKVLVRPVRDEGTPPQQAA